jgi:tetratricopeptide (TPR) repeat protein
MAPQETAADAPSIDLPGEVTLLEKEYEVTAKLAEISVEVAEAYKKRVAIERDMKVARAALDALNAQRTGIETSISSLKQELESVSQDKAGEDRALEELRLKLEASRADLEKLSDLPEFLKSVEAKSSAAADLVSNASTTLETAQRRVQEAQTVSASVEKNASELTSAMDIARRLAEEAQDQLKVMLSDAQAAQAEAAKADASLFELRSAVAGLQQLKDQVNAARADLKSLSPTLQAKTAQATAAISQLESKRSARDSSFQAALADIDGIVSDGSEAVAAVQTGTAPAGNGTNVRGASQSNPAVAPAPAASGLRPSKPDASGGNVEALVSAGRLDDALRASRDSASGSADPDGRMIEAARRVREGGNAAAAAKAYEKLTAAGNQSGAARSGLALCYVDLRRFKESLALFEGLNDGAFAIARENGIGQSLRGLNRIDEAAQHFSKALEIPGHPDSEYRDVLYNLADLYENRADPESLNLAQWSFEEIQAGSPDYRDVSARISSLKQRLTKAAVPDSKGEPQASRDGRF